MPSKNIKISSFFSPRLGKWMILGILGIILFRSIFPFVPFFEQVNIIMYYVFMGVAQRIMLITAWLCFAKWLLTKPDMQIPGRFLIAFLVGNGILLLGYLLEIVVKATWLYSFSTLVNFICTLLILRFALYLFTNLKDQMLTMRLVFASLMISLYLLPWVMQIEVIKDFFTIGIRSISFNVLLLTVSLAFYGVFAYIMHKVSQENQDEIDPNFGLIEEIGNI